MFRWCLGTWPTCWPANKSWSLQVVGRNEYPTEDIKLWLEQLWKGFFVRFVHVDHTSRSVKFGLCKCKFFRTSSVFFFLFVWFLLVPPENLPGFPSFSCENSTWNNLFRRVNHSWSSQFQFHLVCVPEKNLFFPVVLIVRLLFFFCLCYHRLLSFYEYSHPPSSALKSNPSGGGVFYFQYHYYGV